MSNIRELEQAVIEAARNAVGVRMQQGKPRGFAIDENAIYQSLATAIAILNEALKPNPWELLAEVIDQGGCWHDPDQPGDYDVAKGIDDRIEAALKWYDSGSGNE